MHRTSKALLTTLVATALLLPARAANAGATGSLVGVVLNDDTGQPVPGALVGACALQGCQPFATTDSTGAFTFLGVPASTDWSVQTNPDGSCALSTGHHYGIAVPAGGPSAEVVLYVTSRVGSAQGTVYSPSGQPLPGVRVTLDNAETSGSGYGAAYTDSSGHYAVGCLAAAGSGPGSGAYYVTAQPPAPYSEKVDSGIEVPQGGSVLHDVHLTPSSGWIQGRVTCGPVSCGVPMTVVIRCEGCGGAANATTDGGGYYSAAVEGGQKYDVHVFGPPGWDSGIAYAVRVPLYQTGTGNVMLTENGPSTSGRLVGTITDAAGAAIPNCTINAFGPTSFSEGVAVTGSDGTYDTGYTLAPGTFIIFPACVTGVRLSYEPSVRVGQTAEAGYVIPEPPRPFTGGSDAIGATSPGADAYFAEGFTGVNSQFSFHEYLTVENPNPSSETVDVHYLFSTGAPPLVRSYGLAAHSRSTINVNHDVGAGQNVSVWIHAQSGSFVAERPMYFHYAGIGDGGDDVMGAQSLATQFYFAEGYTGPGFAEYLTLMNPSPTNTADVNITYFFNGGPTRSSTHTISPGSRTTVFVNDPSEAGPGHEVSALVTSTNGVQFLAERPMYFDYLGRWSGGHVAVGATQLSTNLDLAEGHVGDGFDEYLTLLNPNPSAATVSITYFLRSGAPLVRTTNVPAMTRQTIFVNSLLPAGSDDSVHVSSSLPIMVERPMYFDYLGRWSGGHDAVALQSSLLSYSFYFAEGYVASNFDQYFTVENPNSTAVGVTFTYFLPSGATKQVFKVVNPHSRFTEKVNLDLPSGSSDSALVSASGGPLLVERPMYFAY